MSSYTNIYFAGPDKEKNLLRDTLLAHIEAVPANGKICWMCYYFNESTLFDALISAAQRGVEIEIILEDRPRSPAINQLCRTTFQNHSNIEIIYTHSKPLWEYFGINWHAYLHSKLYFFSHPSPHILAGSYNPTAGTEEIDTSLIQQIGDHSLSHNVLVNIEEQITVTNIQRYLKKMRCARHRKWARTKHINNFSHINSTWEVNFLPRLFPHPVRHLFSRGNSQTHYRCAISHLKGINPLTIITAASKRGSKIELILDATKRRVSSKQLSQLSRHKIKYYQLDSVNNAIMHNKFILYQSDREHGVLFGSFNWSMRSWWLNHEVLVNTQSPEIVASFEKRWQEMLAQI